VEPSAGSYIITLGAAVLAVGVFLNNVPEQPDLTMSSGLIYGLEFGGAMLLGAAVGYAVGYLIDRSAVDTEKVDLTGVSRLEKFEAIRSILLRTAP
jgi:drug/metabolite transporter (DMT)-like permease